MGMSKKCKAHNPHGVRVNTYVKLSSRQDVSLSAGICKKKNGNKKNFKIGDTLSGRVLTEKRNGSYSIFCDDDGIVWIQTTPIIRINHRDRKAERSDRKQVLPNASLKLGYILDFKFCAVYPLHVGDNLVKSSLWTLDQFAQIVGVQTDSLILSITNFLNKNSRHYE